MSDEVLIQQVLNTYSVAASGRDWDAVIATFADDGVWEIPSLGQLVTGRDAIREALIAMTAGTEYVIQQNSPAVIVVNGNAATARSVICENGNVSESAGGFQALGFYQDDLIRSDEGWRFQRRRFELKGMRHIAGANPPAPA